MNKEINFARLVFQDDTIQNPFPKEIVNRVLSGIYLDYYNECIVNGMSYNDYSSKSGKTYHFVSNLRNQVHDMFCLDKNIAELYRKLHGMYPKLRWQGNRFRYVCELDFLGLSFPLVNILFIKGKISTVDVLVDLIKHNKVRLWNITGYGPKADKELMNWYNQYRLTISND